MEMRGMNSKSTTTSKTTTAGPCITLLQERFRQLKRQREQREEKQVLLETSSSSPSSSSYSTSNKRQHLSSSTSSSTNLMKPQQNMITNKGYSFTKGELMIMPTRRCLEDDPLSLGLNSLSNKHIDYREMMMMRNQLIARQADKRVALKSNSHKFETRDLDTSLHL